MKTLWHVRPANNGSTPREPVWRWVVRPVNNISLTSTPREPVCVVLDRSVVRPVYTLKALPGIGHILGQRLVGFMTTVGRGKHLHKIAEDLAP